MITHLPILNRPGPTVRTLVHRHEYQHTAPGCLFHHLSSRRSRRWPSKCGGRRQRLTRKVDHDDRQFFGFGTSLTVACAQGSHVQSGAPMQPMPPGCLHAMARALQHSLCIVHGEPGPVQPVYSAATRRAGARTITAGAMYAAFFAARLTNARRVDRMSWSVWWACWVIVLPPGIRFVRTSMPLHRHPPRLL